MTPMSAPQTVRCPNCGNIGERRYLHSSNLVRTQCPHCDYLMVSCSETGRVIEAYSPGLYLPGM
ncbi:replication restart DNA helicase PriA [Baaleninema sp.]|uniref:replication restart DNA helicase PriA n=1 Tax=Baaleninema sp. TaxID=3101197 RepID=UPI003CFDDCE7